MVRTEFDAVMNYRVVLSVRFDSINALHGNQSRLVGDLGASFRTTTGQHFAASSGGHAGTESAEVAVFFLGWLISFFRCHG